MRRLTAEVGDVQLVKTLSGLVCCDDGATVGAVSRNCMRASH